MVWSAEQVLFNGDIALKCVCTLPPHILCLSTTLSNIGKKCPKIYLISIKCL